MQSGMETFEIKAKSHTELDSSINIVAYGKEFKCLFNHEALTSEVIESGIYKEITNDGMVEIEIEGICVKSISFYSRGKGPWTKEYFSVPFDSELAKLLICIPDDTSFLVPEGLKTEPLFRNGKISFTFFLYDYFIATEKEPS